MDYMKIIDHSGYHLLHFGRIVRIQSINNYSKIFFADHTTLVVSKVLLWFEHNLPSESFTRVHRSHLVNNMYIDKTSQTCSHLLVLTNGETVAISRRRKIQVLATIYKPGMLL